MYNMAYNVPKWLYKIKEGKYTIKELVALTGTSRNNLYMRLNHLRVKKVNQVIDGRLVGVYHWKGAAYYLRISYKLLKKGVSTHG